MTRSPLILAALALTLALAGCGNRSVGNKIDDQFIAPEVSSSVARAHIDLTSPTSHIVVTSYNGFVLLAGGLAATNSRGDFSRRSSNVHPRGKVSRDACSSHRRFTWCCLSSSNVSSHTTQATRSIQRRLRVAQVLPR